MLASSRARSCILKHPRHRHCTRGLSTASAVVFDDDDHDNSNSNNNRRTKKNKTFPRMFQSLDLGPSIGKLPNRIIMGSMHTGLEGHSIPSFLLPLLKADDNHDDLTAMAAYFQRRAEGGVGLMVTGGIAPNREGWVGPFAAKLSTEDEMLRHVAVTDAVHSVRIPSYDHDNDNRDHDNHDGGERARICLQILHAGRYAHHPFAVSASATQSPISPFPARALSTQQVQSTVHDFVRCAVLAKQAGYDGVEIMGSEGYLIHQFLVNKTNLRDDAYGGDFPSRMKFALDIVSQTRAAVGEDFILIFRLSMLDLMEGNGGSSWEEIKLLAQALEDAGVTIINTGIGWHEARIPTIATSVPRGAFSFVTKKMREEGVVSVPLCATNRVNAPNVAEGILENEGADLISMARPFLADPDIVKKSRIGGDAVTSSGGIGGIGSGNGEGVLESINTCIACNQACLDHAFVGKVASCLVNPLACHETELSVEKDSVPEHERLNIGVIGSGPAGLAFATTAATIGHTVTLYDKSPEIGGQFNMAKRIPGKEEFHETIRYFNWKTRELEREGRLSICLGPEYELSHDDMLRASENGNGDGDDDGDVRPVVDKWILATGVTPRTPSIPGIDHPNVLSYIDVLRNNAKVGQNVAIIGAGGIGFDVAEFLIHHDDHQDHDIGADEVSVGDFLTDWRVDATNESRGGLLSPSASSNGTNHSTIGHSSGSGTGTGRNITMLQRKKGKLGKNLGKTTGWIHRATLAKSNAVDMIGSVTYDKVDENGHLHITIKKGTGDEEKKVLEVDNIVTCAGQISLDALQKEAEEGAASQDIDFGRKVYTIGGAYEALELDAKRAIDMGTRLALKISDPTVVPGKHEFHAGKGPEEKMFGFLQRLMR